MNGGHSSELSEYAIKNMFGTNSNSVAQRKGVELADRIDRLSLICMAMWSLIQDKTDLTEADLIKRVHDIDIMDGVEDGKASRSVSECQNCGRTLSARHKRCLYCGAEKLASSAFDNI